MIEKVGGKSIPTLVAEGRGQFASMPAGGKGGAAPAQAASAPVAAKVEEKPKEEEVDVDMGDLFGY